MEESKQSKVLVLLTIVILVGIAGVFLMRNHSELPLAIPLQTKGQPTIGYTKAPVHVVVFEEPKCPDCKKFSTLIFPEIKKNFIDTNKILYTLIPVSFLPHSMPAAIAWLCVFNQEASYPNRDLFFKYVDYMYANQPSEEEDWATEKKLQEFATKASSAIHLDTLQHCLDHEAYRIQIEKNTAYGMHIMKGELSTPTLYVDGMRVDDISYSHIRDLIEGALRQKGAK